MSKIPIEYGKYYHIYNRGNNYENIFLQEKHYLHFLKLYSIFIEPIAETYAWCLMKNHFHFFVKIKEENEIGYLSTNNAKREDLSIKWNIFFPEILTSEFIRKPIPSKMFQHLFNSYAHWFNLQTGRKDTLFSKEFERKLVDNQIYYRDLIIYINNNPVHHGFVEDTFDYLWSSYHAIVSNQTTKLKRNEVIKVFGDLDNFKHIHKLKQDIEKIKNYLID
jgi:REP element-mobilizing transposase RayT